MELLWINPRDPTPVAAGHQRRKEVVVAVAANTTGFMSIDLEPVTDLMAGTATLGD